MATRQCQSRGGRRGRDKRRSAPEPRRICLSNMAIKQHRRTRRRYNLGAWDPRPSNRIREQTWARSGDRFRHRERHEKHSAFTTLRGPPTSSSPSFPFGNMCSYLLEIDIWISMSRASRMPGASSPLEESAGRNNPRRHGSSATWISDVKRRIGSNVDDSVETGVFVRMGGEQCHRLERC